LAPRNCMHSSGKAMVTRREERINQLAQALKRVDKIHLKDAAQLLGVSEMTIRRDLSSEGDTLVLLGGYVVMDPKINTISHYFVSDQKSKQVDEKRHIGQLAAQQIVANDTVFFDCGTTIPLIIDAIDVELPFTAICYSLNTFLALQDKPLCRVLLSGGEFHANNAIFAPLGQHKLLDQICPSKAFISAAGICMRQGASCFNFEELDMKQSAISISQQRFLVADHSKFGKVKPARIGELSLFDTLITDSQPDSDFVAYCKRQHIALLY